MSEARDAGHRELWKFGSWEKGTEGPRKDVGNLYEFAVLPAAVHKMRCAIRRCAIRRRAELRCDSNHG